LEQRESQLMNEYDQNQGYLFNPKDYSTGPVSYGPRRRSEEDHSKPIKEYAHELGMIKDLIAAVMNRIDAIEEMMDMQTEMLEDLTDTLLDP
jgi:hypothetical protein